MERENENKSWNITFAVVNSVSKHYEFQCGANETKDIFYVKKSDENRGKVRISVKVTNNILFICEPDGGNIFVFIMFNKKKAR